MLFLFMGTGVLAAKAGIITAEGRKSMTDLVIDIVLPCNIIISFYVEFSPETLASMGRIFIAALGIQCLQLFLSRILYRQRETERRKIMQYGTICSNAGYLGNPVAEGLYGATGLLYTSVYLIPARIFLWSAGLSLFTDAGRKDIVKKLLTHPCIIAVEIGLVLMLGRITLPAMAETALRSIGSCTTVLSMLTIGAVVAESDVCALISRDSLYYCFVRLLLIPGIVLCAGLMLHWEPVLLGISVILAGMPAGATTTLLAGKYHGDAAFASQCTVLSTLLSMAAVPMWCMFLINVG